MGDVSTLAAYCSKTERLGVEILVYNEVKSKEGQMPDKSPRKPSAKKPPDRSLKETRQDKKGKKTTNNPFGA